MFYENRVYAIGGENEDGVFSDSYLYQPETDSWEQRAPKPTAVTDIKAAVLGGKIYVPGGRQQTGEVTNVLEIYDPREDVWNSGAPMPFPLSAYALTVFEGQLYLFGGWNGQKFVDSVLSYNPNRDTWIEMTPMPLKRGFSGAEIAGGKMYVFGGYDGKKALNTNHIYFLERDQSGENPWEEAAPLPEARFAMGTAVIADVVYLIGGEGAGKGVFSQMEYFPFDDRWQTTQNPLAETWSHIGVVPFGTQLYTLGGALNGEPTQRNLVYQVIFVVVIPVIR